MMMQSVWGRVLFLACATLGAACAPSTTATAAPSPSRTVEEPSASRETRGSLFIVGGGARSSELMARFVELAGGPGHARIAVVPMASGDSRASGEAMVEEFQGLGAEAINFLLTRSEAMADSTVRRLADVTGIWFTGGDQSRLTPILLGTPALEAMHARYRSGAVVGGTSAGAAIMSDSMITGNQYRAEDDSLGYYGDEFPQVARGTIQLAPGLGFLSGAVVDQHFLQRERHNRLISVVLEHPSLIGVGIDESTAVIMGPDGEWRVVGESAVVIYDARGSRITPAHAPVLGAAGVHMHLLPPGSRYDPQTGRAEIPAARPVSSTRVVSPDLQFSQLAPGVWIHTSWYAVPNGTRFPSNGLIVRDGDRLLLIDTAWGEHPTEQLLAWIDRTLQLPVGRAIERAARRYDSALRVVPGHGDAGGPELLRHTRSLFTG